MIQINRRNTIGIKKISDSELGRSRTSNQTHIGLFEGTVSFAEHQIISSQLIYDNRVIELLSLIDFIRNPDGSFRSPKIRFGNKNELIFNGSIQNSVVRKIRDIASGTNSDWYLMWFGLDTNELTFHLFNNTSTDFRDIQTILGEINERMQIKPSSTNFNNLINYLNEKIDSLNLQYYMELETNIQTNSTENTRRFVPRIRDIERAQTLWKETGRKGEQILNDYLEFQKSNQIIKDFEWLNQRKETGLPYDFKIIKNDNSFVYSDAKATRYKFDAPIILSSGELSFINKNKDKYLIHRLYSVFDRPKLRVCENISNISDVFIPNYRSFSSSLENQQLKIKATSISVPTNLEIITFEDEILLNTRTRR